MVKPISHFGSEHAHARTKRASKREGAREQPPTRSEDALLATGIPPFVIKTSPKLLIYKRISGASP